MPRPESTSVIFTLAALIVAFVISLLRGGRIRRLADAEIPWVGVLLTGLLLQIVADAAAGRGLIPEALVTTALLASLWLVLLFISRNLAMPGMWLIGLGWLLNAVVIGLNGAMPVDPAAVGGSLDVANIAGKHEVMTETTVLPWLGDRIPVALLRTTLSVGDLLLAAGMIPLVHGLMGPRPGVWLSVPGAAAR